MKISAVVGEAGRFLKVSGGQVITCPADFHIPPHDRASQRTMKISTPVGMAGWFLKVSRGQVITCPSDD
jgi:hypothetical protein